MTVSDERRNLSPVLVLGFDRPELLGKVLSALEPSRRRVYVSLDGPRELNAGDAERCAETARVVFSSPVTHDSRIRVHDKNLGCRFGVSAGLSWFFGKESEGIILEDDCIPNDSFLRFCDQMLEQYREHPQVGHISGTRFFGENADAGSPAFFSHFASVWGWATWRNRWENFERINASSVLHIDKSTISSVSRAPFFYNFWERQLNKVFDGRLDTWDYVWLYSLWVNGLFAIVPPVNLVRNQGFGPWATHTRRKPLYEDFRPVARELASHEPVSVSEKIDHGYNLKAFWLVFPILGQQVRAILRLLWVALGGIRR